MRLSYFLFLTAFTLITACEETPKTPEQLRNELWQKELATPKTYVTLEQVVLSPDRKKVREAGLFREAEYEDDGATIAGIIKNTASIAKFKDVVITVSYLSKTKTVISQEEKTFYNYYPPNSSTPFTFKVYPPKEMKNFSSTLVDVSAVFEK